MNKTACSSLLAAALAFASASALAEVAWTTGSCAPADWSALEGNILLNILGTTTADGVPSYASGNVAVLTDGDVPRSSPDKAGIFGFRVNENVSWAFDAPKTIDRIRICTCYFGGASYDGVHVAKVEVMPYGGSAWEEIAGDCENKGGSAAGNVNFIVLENGGDPVAQNIVGLKVTFGTCETGFANYYCEIEAVGAAGALGPTIGSFGITPAKTKATVSGLISDAGTDATACDIYLALDGETATKIASGVTGEFEYLLKGLTAGTTYSYTLSVSNNAPTVKGTVRSDTFTTLAADAQTASWTQGEYAPTEWTVLAKNILAGLDATAKSGLSNYASSDMTKLTDGSVPALEGSMTDAQAGADTVGFTPNGTIAWTFATPMTIEKIRLSSLWKNTSYNGISVNAIHVKNKDSADWTALDVPTVEWKGGSQIGQTETLSDAEFGFLAENVVALKITFGDKKAAFANYYAEIEAVGHPSVYPTIMLFR